VEGSPFSTVRYEDQHAGPQSPAPRQRLPHARFGRSANAIAVGHKTNSIFFTRIDPETHTSAIYKANTNTGVKPSSNPG
jgi:hypothetical protein